MYVHTLELQSTMKEGLEQGGRQPEIEDAIVYGKHNLLRHLKKFRPPQMSAMKQEACLSFGEVIPHFLELERLWCVSFLSVNYLGYTGYSH